MGKKKTKTATGKPQEQAPVPKPRKPGYIFGWYYNGNGHCLYVQKRTPRTPKEEIPPGYEESAWWPTEHEERATRFKGVEECLAYFREIYWIKGEAEADRFIRNVLYILKETPFGLLRVQHEEQLSLFDLLPQASALSPRIEALGRKGFSLDEAKILAAGFNLVRYVREEKRIDSALPDGPEPDTWLKGLPDKTFAAAEKRLAAILEAPREIFVSEGCVSTAYKGNKSWGKLTLAGFDFYRKEGVTPGHGTPRIKCYSRNWGTWEKFETPAQVEAAWEELMKNEKALEG